MYYYYANLLNTPTMKYTPIPKTEINMCNQTNL